MAKLAASTYGEALFELAVESNQADKYMQEALAVMASFEENSELVAMLNHPKIDKEKKIVTIEDIYSSFISKDMVGFLVLAVKKGRHNEIPDILRYFVDKVKDYRKIGVVYVSTPMELSAQQKAKVEAKLKETTSYVSFEMNYSVDKSLIGGMVIRIGDRVVDSSIKRKLSDLSKDLNKIKMA